MEYVFFTENENGYKLHWTNNIDEFHGNPQFVKEIEYGLGKEYKNRLYGYLYSFLKNKHFVCSEKDIFDAFDKNDWFYKNIFYQEKKVLDKVPQRHITLLDITGKLYSYCYEREFKGKSVQGPEYLPDDLFYRSDVHYVKAKLEDHFSPRKFSLAEVKGLIESTFLEGQGNELIPEWYKTKWFKTV